MNEELNKKLAEWAGFWCDKGGNSLSGIYIRPRWYMSDPYYKDLDLPDFTESLDACFKWLVPKLVRMGAWVSCGIDENEAFALVDAENDDFYDLFDGKHFEGEAITPALALCLAIEKLIEVK